ncbi:MAG TPA: methyltransferase domain-containing protein [Marmoricola sp.]|nr:methyltransferase domain-containing protein [Marmoricola sp.]
MTNDGVPSRAATEGWRVDDEGIHPPASVDRATTYDVLLNGRHAWSLVPSRDVVVDGGRATGAWPSALRKHLRGRAIVVVRDHLTDEVVSTTDHVFAGDDSTDVELTDRAGRPLIVDKWGRLTRPLSQQDPDTVEELLDAAVRVLDVLREDAGVPAFVAYGTLLGAVRDGRLIGHDNDLDLAYVSEHAHPVDVVREAYRVERALRDAGFVVRRGSGTRLNVRLWLGDGSMRAIDVFTAHWVEGVLYIPSDTGFRLPRGTILPLGTVTLHGRAVPAPADPEPLLAATYGEGWRKPDPAFKYETPRWLARRLNGWFGGLISHRKHWDSFYAQHRQELPRGASSFAHWVAEEYPTSRPLVDLGCGTGRDALWFARNGRRVEAMDYNISVVRRGNNRSSRRELDARFHLVNFYDSRAALAWGARLARDDEPVDLYARFLWHALDDPGRENVLRLASMALRRGGHLFLEFRTDDDAGRPHAFSGESRDYCSPGTVRADVEAAGGRVVHQEAGTGLAAMGDEDPHVCRMVATWSEGV